MISTVRDGPKLKYGVSGTVSAWRRTALASQSAHSFRSGLELLACSIGLPSFRTPAHRRACVRNAAVAVGLALMDRVWIALMASAVLLLFAVLGILILRPELIEATRVVRSDG